MQSLSLDGADSAGPRFPGERRVSLAPVFDFNGHQASFQAGKKKGTGRGRVGRGAFREVMKPIRLVTSLTGRGRVAGLGLFPEVSELLC